MTNYIIDVSMGAAFSSIDDGHLMQMPLLNTGNPVMNDFREPSGLITVGKRWIKGGLTLCMPRHGNMLGG